jgi:hypothetical protein
MFEIGDAVQTPRYFGVIHDRRGGPNGVEEFEVRRIGGPDETAADFFRAEELAPAPLPDFDVSHPVYLNGGVGRIVEQHGDEFLVEIIRPRGCGMAWRHLYRVPGWRLALGNS